jgi:hypothetical protein
VQKETKSRQLGSSIKGKKSRQEKERRTREEIKEAVRKEMAVTGGTCNRN